MKFAARSLWILAMVAAPLLVIVFLSLGLLPFEVLRSIANRLSKDGSMVSFTPALLIGLRPIVLFLGMVFLAAAAGLGIFRQKSLDKILAGLNGINSFFRTARQDSGQLVHDARNIRFSRLEIGVLLAATAAGLFNRLVLLPAPMGYDESYTFMAFARHPFWNIISDYELPNNHIFHTILVRISFLLFGNSPEIIRLPALIAGILVIPLVYLVARKHFNRETGWMAAGLVAFWPLATAFSVNARGYSLLMLFTLLLLALAFYLVEKRNIAGWLALILVSALGFYTVPVMLYPFATVMAWILLSVWADRAHPAYRVRQFLKYFILSGIGTLVLTGILYSPVIYRSGWRSLFANTFIQSFTWSEFLTRLPDWADSFWQVWTDKIPLLVVGLILVGLAAGLAFHRKISAHKVSVPAVMLVCLAAMTAVQRPELLPKIFLALVPVVAISVAAGWSAILHWIPKIRKFNPASSAALLITLALLLGSYQLARPNLPYLTSTVQGELEKTVVYIKAHYQPGEIVIATFPDDPQIWYYSMVHGLDLDSMIGIHQKIYTQVWVIVKETDRQTLTSVIADAKLTAAQPDLQRAILQTSIDNVKIYTVPSQ